MSAILAYVVVLVVLVAVLVIEEKRDFSAKLVVDEHARDAWNLHAYAVWEDSGWYPQELADGKVRWYRVRHDNAVDHGRAVTG